MQLLMKNVKGQPASESILSVVILLALAAIATAVWVTQGKFDEQIASYPTGEPSAQAAEAGTQPDLFWPDDSTGEKFKTFNVDTLADIINGKAETCFQAGFDKLFYKRVSLGDESKPIGGSIYIFQMLSPEAAFSVYSTQRRPGSQSVALGDSAYQAQNLLAFIVGKFYVELVCDEVSSQWLDAMRDRGLRFVENQPVSKGSLLELDLFPADGLIPNSHALTMRDVFSFGELDRVFTAGYMIAGHQTTAFISVRESAEKAKELATAYANFLTGLTESKAVPVEGVEGAVLIDVFGEYEVIFSRGEILAGVHAAGDPKTAADLARLLAEVLDGGKASD